MTPIDAVGAYSDGTLRRVTVGRVQLLRREGRVPDLRVEVAEPIAELAANLTAAGASAEASTVLEHAIHDGVPAAVMAQAVAAHATKDTQQVALAQTITVGPKGELRAGLPPAATDLSSALNLLNDLRHRLT